MSGDNSNCYLLDSMSSKLILVLRVNILRVQYYYISALVNES